MINCKKKVFYYLYPPTNQLHCYIINDKFNLWCIWINIFHDVCRCTAMNRVTGVQPPVSDNIVIEMSFDRGRENMHFNDF